MPGVSPSKITFLGIPRLKVGLLILNKKSVNRQTDRSHLNKILINLTELVWVDCDDPSDMLRRQAAELFQAVLRVASAIKSDSVLKDITKFVLDHDWRLKVCHRRPLSPFFMY